jgi:hypothetical protein
MNQSIRFRLQMEDIHCFFARNARGRHVNAHCFAERKTWLQSQSEIKTISPQLRLVGVFSEAADFVNLGLKMAKNFSIKMRPLTAPTFTKPNQSVP